MDFSVFQASDFALAACMFAGAALYTSVGHAGASAYIALMALFGLPAPVMRPTALVLNILVASLSSFRFLRAGLFRWRTLWPVLTGAIPMAFLGGSLHLPGSFYKPLVGAVLLVAAARLLWNPKLPHADDVRDIPVAWGVLIGAAIELYPASQARAAAFFSHPSCCFSVGRRRARRQAWRWFSSFAIPSPDCSAITHQCSRCRRNCRSMPRPSSRGRWWEQASASGGWRPRTFFGLSALFW